MTNLEEERIVSELGSKGVAIEVTQSEWPSSTPRSANASAILLYRPLPIPGEGGKEARHRRPPALLHE